MYIASDYKLHIYSTAMVPIKTKCLKIRCSLVRSNLLVVRVHEDQIQSGRPLCLQWHRMTLADLESLTLLAAEGRKEGAELGKFLTPRVNRPIWSPPTRKPPHLSQETAQSVTFRETSAEFVSDESSRISLGTGLNLDHPFLKVTCGRLHSNSGSGRRIELLAPGL